MGRRPSPPRVYLHPDEHGDIYQYSFTVNRRRYQGSTGLRNEAEAQSWVDDHAAKIRLGRPVERPRQRVSPVGGDEHAVDLLVARFLVHLEDEVARGNLSSSYTTKIEDHFRLHFLPRWQTIYDVIEPGAIDAWTDQRLRSPTKYKGPHIDKHGRKLKGRPNRPKPSLVTVHKELVSLRRFLKWAKAEQIIREVPSFRSVDQTSDYVPPDYTPEDVEAVLKAIPDRHTHKKRMPAREFFTVQWAQALRPDQELGTLRWCDVNLRRREMTIRATVSKNSKPRTIHMADETHAILSEMAQEDSHPPTALIFGRHNFIASLKAAASKLGLPIPSRHNLRHFRLTELGNSPGTAVATLQYFAGHLHLQTTDKYVRSRTKATVDMLKNLPPRK